MRRRRLSSRFPLEEGLKHQCGGFSGRISPLSSRFPLEEGLKLSIPITCEMALILSSRFPLEEGLKPGLSAILIHIKKALAADFH